MTAATPGISDCFDIGKPMRVAAADDASRCADACACRCGGAAVAAPALRSAVSAIIATVTREWRARCFGFGRTLSQRRASARRQLIEKILAVVDAIWTRHSRWARRRRRRHHLGQTFKHLLLRNAQYQSPILALAGHIRRSQKGYGYAAIGSAQKSDLGPQPCSLAIHVEFEHHTVDR